MKKTLFSTAGALAVLLALTGCAGTGGGSPKNYETPTSGEDGRIKFYSVQLPDGEFVDCVGSSYTGSTIIPDCDWANVSTGSSGAESGTLRSYTVTAPGGRQVVCVGSRYSGSTVAPDCDWSQEASR